MYHAAALYDEGTVPTRESSIAKYYAGEVCNRAAQAAYRRMGLEDVPDAPGPRFARRLGVAA